MTEDLAVTAQYHEITANATTMNVLQWQQNVTPNFRLDLVGEKDIILYTGNKEITVDMIPDGWTFINTALIDNNQTPKYQAVIYNPDYYTYDAAAGTYYASPISALETANNAGSAAFGVPLIENGTNKQFVMVIFVVNGDSVITNETNMTSAMSEVMQSVTQKYESASGIVISLQASTWDNNGGNTGHHASGYFSGLDSSAFVKGYDLVSWYEAVTKKTPGISRDYATYLLSYMKEGQIVKVDSAKTINAATAGAGVTVYNGLSSTIIFDTVAATESEE